MAGSWIGMDEAIAKITASVARADVEAKLLVAKGAAAVERAAKANFAGSHKKGQPHVGGNKPNIVTGTLRRSISTDPTSRVALGEYETTVGPTVIYGRRVELGFKGKSRPFPYFAPGAESASKEFDALQIEAWMKVRGV